MLEPSYTRVTNEETATTILSIIGCRTQISFVRNLANEIFPPQMKERDACRLARDLAQFFCDQYRAEDVTADEYWSSVVSDRYGLASKEDRTRAYRLVRIEGLYDFDLWIEIMSANHLTFSIAGSFWDFEVKVATLQGFVDAVGKKLAFAYDTKLGYLATQLPLVGSGLRIRTWMHLNALARYHYLNMLSNAMEALGVFVEMEDDTIPDGHIYILFNRSAIHAHPVEIVKSFRRALVLAAWHEANCRHRFYSERPFELYDILEAARAQFTSRHLLSERTALFALSDLQMAYSIQVVRSAYVRKLFQEEPWFCATREALLHFFIGPEMILMWAQILPPYIQKDQVLLRSAWRALWARKYAKFEYSKRFLKKVKGL